MFKLSKNINEMEVSQIKEGTQKSFGHETYQRDDIHDYGLIYDSNNVASSGLINNKTKFVFNLCTHPNYRKKGYANQLTKIIMDKYRNLNKYQVLTLDTETDSRGVIPRNMYLKLGWQDVETTHSKYRNLMFFMPLTGICDKPTQLITDNIITKQEILNSFSENPISTLTAIIRYILQKETSIHLSNLQDKPRQYYENFYQHLFLYNKNNCHYLFNHLLVIELDESDYYKETLILLKNNYKTADYFCLILIHNNHFCIINKVKDVTEYIVSSKLPEFLSVIKYI